MAQTTTALYHSVEKARAVVDDLVATGFDHKEISLIAPDPDGGYAETIREGRAAEGHNVRDAAAAGGMAGGALGGLAGLLFGLGALTIPGIGPVVLAGPLYTTVMGASIGGVGGGLLAALVDKGIPKKQAAYYAEGLRRGYTFVGVETDGKNLEQVTAIMNRHDPVDFQRAVEEWELSDAEWPGEGGRPEEFVPDRDKPDLD